MSKFKPVSANTQVSQSVNSGMLATSTSNHSDTVFARHEQRLMQSGTDVNKLRDEVNKISNGFDPKKPDGISTFGSNSGQRVVDHSDKLLAQVKAKDIEGMGDKLTEVVQLAKGINVSGLVNGTGSKIPLIG